MAADESAIDPARTKRVRTAYHNGSWINSDSLALQTSDPAITQGVTAVERLRAYSGELFQLDRHLRRWQRSVDALKIAGLPDAEAMRHLFQEALSRNVAWIDQQSEFGLVTFATPGQDAQPTLVIDLYPIDSDLISRRVSGGSPAYVTSVQVPSASCWPRDIKVRCRLHYYLADQLVSDFPKDSIGLLIDDDRTVMDCSIANLLVVERDTLISPPREQVLHGVSLQVVLELADRCGIPWREERLKPERVRSADEVLLTGTSCCLWFANSVDGSNRKPAGPIYRRLRTAVDDLVQSDSIRR